MRMRFFITLMLLSFIATGCASTKIETSGFMLKEPFCSANEPAVSALVYWGPQWRPDQKEPQLREAAALRGIEHFLSSTHCITVTGIKRLSWERQPPEDQELLRLASESALEPNRVLLIVIRELGPRLIVGIPAMVEGGTEVQIDVRVLNPKTSELLASTKTVWRNGGRFVIKGSKTLDQDMSSALRSVLLPAVSGQ